MSNLRAKYILMSPQAPQLYAVYDATVQLRDIEPLAYQLNIRPGVQAAAIMAAVDSPRKTPTATLKLNLLLTEEQTELEQTLALFKQLTQPELSVALSILVVELMTCSRCRHVSPRVSQIEFIVGFDPGDIDAFMFGLFRELDMLGLTELYQRQPRSPYPPVYDAIEALLATLGANTSQLYLRVVPDERPCTHI
jgi:hypothetical protein